MGYIVVSFLSAIVFLIIPGFDLKENFRKKPTLTILALIIGAFLLFFSILSITKYFELTDKKKGEEQILAPIKNASVLTNQGAVTVPVETLDMEFEAVVQETKRLPEVEDYNVSTVEEIRRVTSLAKKGDVKAIRKLCFMPSNNPYFSHDLSYKWCEKLPINTIRD